MLDVCRKRPNYTPRNLDRQPKTPPLRITVTSSDIMEGKRDPGCSLDEEVLREILQREIRSLFFKAVDQVANPNYREPYLFSILFADHLTYSELAAIFDISPNSINSCMKRASKMVAANFQQLLKEKGFVDQEDLKYALSQLSDRVRTTFIEDSAADPATQAIIKARFTEKKTPAEILDTFNLTAQELSEIEHNVMQEFLKTLDTVRAIRSAAGSTPFPKGDTMGFYDNFMQYLNTPPTLEQHRADIPLDKDVFDFHEIVKLVLPTARQDEQFKIRKAVSRLSMDGISKVTDATALTPAEISAAINDPDAYATQYRLLLHHLGIDTTVPRD